MNRAMTTAAVLGTALLCSACYRMTITSGRAPAPAPKVEDRWRSTTVLDAVEIDKPLPLDLECKETGWATIEQRRNGLNWLVDVFLAGVVYESTHVNVYCAQAAPAPAPAPAPSAAPPVDPNAPGAPAPATPPAGQGTTTTL
jgi:hypothetical protein